MNGVCEDIIAIQHCRKGSKKAFEPIVNRYMKRAYFIALGLVGNQDDALELSQEAFFRAYSNLDRLNEKSSFFPWFYQILKNLCFSHLRRRSYRQAESLDTHNEDNSIAITGGCFDPEMIAENNELKVRLWKAIGKLSNKHREVIILRHFQNLSYEQMAQALYCSKGSVTSRLYHARGRLKELLNERKEVGQNDLPGS